MLGGFGGALEELGGFGALESKHRTLGEERLNNCGLVSDKARVAHLERGDRESGVEEGVWDRFKTYACVSFR